MPRTLLATYPRETRRFDEMVGLDGEPRPAWHAFFDHIGRAAPGLARAQLDFVRRAILENGVTYNVYADPKGADRPWELDPLPLILSGDEWSEISAAVVQRARLLNAMLADLYGPQTLLADGSLPPELVYGHNGYLWPCRGIRPPGDAWLHLYAADLARSPDGRWWVIGDRTQSPSGAGYALENRVIVSRLFSDRIRDLGVLHLTPFFDALQDGLARWAPADDTGAPPLIVLLTPGPYNETYFEHAYLARHLGYPLVEGQDLTVRGDRVYLRTLTGLVRVHAILRRLDDDFCDPLELRGDSALGVPGLLQAVRAGNVLVANALGSGLLQSPALPGFLPGACERLLGERLAMPSVGTWWCGEPAALEFVVAHLDSLVIKGAFPSQRMNPVFGSDLDRAARETMIERLRARPYAYVAQEIVHFSQAPSWSDADVRRLVPRGVAVRVYVVATPEGHCVMPGGLTRATAAADARFISLQRGGASKDTWVLGGGDAGAAAPLRAQIGRADLVRGGSNLSSRVVENLFWFGRYSERCEDEARLLRVTLSRVVDAGAADLPVLAAAFELARALQVLPDAKEPTAESEPPSLALIEARALAALFGDDPDVGLAGNVRRLLWVGVQVRERLSVDNWRALRHLQSELQDGARTDATIGDALAFLDRMVLATSALAGFAMDDMTRDDGWRFLVLGRRLERLIFLAGATAEFLRGDAARTPGCIEWLLELADSIITYRSRYMAAPELLPAIDLIVFDDANPHSVVFQLQSLARYLARLPRETADAQREPLLACLARLAEFDLDGFADGFADAATECAACAELAALLARIAGEAGSLSDRLAMRHFTHVGDVGRQTLAA